VQIRPRVTCIVLNWNGWRDTLDCLAALKESSYPELEVVVVDNGSTDQSVAQISAAHPDVTLLQTGANLGFAGGNNAGIRYGLKNGAEYVWLLNNDTRPAPDALSALVAKALTDSRIGAVGSVCYFADRPEIVQIWAGGRANLWIGYSPNTDRPHDDAWFHWLNGTSLLLSAAALQDIGLLDQGIFLYWEDVEIGLRLRQRGWRLAAAPESKVLHKVSASTSNNKILLDRFATASALRILKLYSAAPPVAIGLFLIIRFARRLLRLQVARCRSVWQGIQDYRQSSSPLRGAPLPKKACKASTTMKPTS
jgi:GT2 family glycosyltransferase